jgi:hypothetical protein
VDELGFQAFRLSTKEEIESCDNNNNNNDESTIEMNVEVPKSNLGIFISS